MKQARQLFMEIDMTETSGPVVFPVTDDGSGAIVKTVDLAEYNAESEEELEQILNEEAEDKLDEVDVDSSDYVGYEVITEDGETSREVGFVITEN
jgi:hypothetical protein